MLNAGLIDEVQAATIDPAIFGVPARMVNCSRCGRLRSG
jgi:hypothetical protein